MGITDGGKWSVGSQSSGRAQDVRHMSWLQPLWAAGRLPILLLVLFLLREPFAGALTDLTALVNPERFTHRAIDLISTPASRILLLFGFAASTALICLWAQRLRQSWAFPTSVLGVILLSALAFVWGETSLKLLAPMALLAAANLLPDRLFERALPTSKRRNQFMIFAIGIAEVLMLRRYLEWVTSLVIRRPVSLSDGLAGVLPSALLLGTAMALLLKSTSLVGIEQAIRMSSHARILATGNFNWIEIDPERRQLLVTGHGVPNLLRYNLEDMAAPPFKSPVNNAGAQGFAYDPQAGEIYVLNAKTKDLLYLDAATLEQKRSIAVPDLSEGDSWISVDGKTGTLTIASEADAEAGVPFLVIDRNTGTVRDRRKLDPGNLLAHPDKPLLYLSFFRRHSKIMVYDLGALSIKAEASAPPKVDRMLFRKERNEVLLAVPLQSRIVRLDADTLKQTGEIKVIFGVRVMAVDEKRQLMLAGSLVTGEVAVVDLRSETIVARYYLGPWIRTVQVDPIRGKAYISSHDALYELNYEHLR